MAQKNPKRIASGFLSICKIILQLQEEKALRFYN